MKQEDSAKSTDTKSYLETVVYSKQEVNDWLVGANTGYRYRTVHEIYDGELGWLPHSGHLIHGINRSKCHYSYDPSGARRMTRFEDRPCRINTYGDSMTHCDQVSDGETWQERLAAHISEPIRNFGVSGHSVYQAFTRMKREEARTPAKYIILNIYHGDHFRNLSEWYWSLSKVDERRPIAPHVKANSATGEFVEYPNPCPTPDSLYNLCNLDWVCHHFQDDFFLRILVARECIKKGTPEKSYGDITSLSREYGLKNEIDDPKTLASTLDHLHNSVALYSSMRILEKVEEFVKSQDKKILYLLSYDATEVSRFIRGEARFDQPFVDFLKKRKLAYVDTLSAHLEDYSLFKMSPEDYAWRYYVPPPYVGHYGPAGYFFLAFAAREKLVSMLDPKPEAYSEGE